LKDRKAKNTINYIKSILVFYCVSIILLSTLFSSISAFAEDRKGTDPQYLFYKGNTLYEEGKYEEAIKMYTKLIEQGLESGYLYYNIGNSYFKKGEFGKAILHYEKANRLIPYDSDLRSNYTYVLTKIPEVSMQISFPWYKRMFAAFGGLTVNGLTILLSIIYVLILLSMIFFFFIPQSKKYSRIIAGILLVLFLTGIASLYDRISLIDREAIVTVESTEARFEPLKNATSHFTLYEGMKVTVLQSRKDWSKVGRADGKAGWIKSKTMGKI